MQVIPVTAVHRGFGQTARRDTWWAAPLAVFLGLSAFVVYATWAAFQGEHYTTARTSRRSTRRSCSATRRTPGSGPSPAGGRRSLPFSPALLILPFPGGFRFTCYYYRGAYYKAFWADPPSCAVGEPRKSYSARTRFPLILQNVHRYFLYIALVVHRSCSPTTSWKALWFDEPGHRRARVRHRRRHARAR